MSASYGWPTTFPGLGFDKQTDRYATALIATPVILILLTGLASLGRMYAKEVQAGGFRHRLVPPFGIGDPRAHWLQNLDLGLFVVFPLLSSISLFVKFLSGQFCSRGKPILGLPASSQPTGCDVIGANVIGNFGLHFKYVSFSDAFVGQRYVYQGGVDYVPFWEPCAFVLAWIVLLIALSLWAKQILRHSNNLTKGC